VGSWFGDLFPAFYPLDSNILFFHYPFSQSFKLSPFGFLLIISVDCGIILSLELHLLFPSFPF